MTDAVQPVSGADVAARLEELREELTLGRERAKVVAGTLALSVQADRVPPRELLLGVRKRVIPGADAEASPAAFIIGIRLDNQLGDRLGKKRASAVKWSDAQARLERATARLGAGHPETRRLERMALVARAYIPDERAGAIDDFRAHLADLGYPARCDFAISLAAAQFAKVLRTSGSPADLAEARSIAQACVTWRGARYGDQHPFTLVALAHIVLAELKDLETASDHGPLRSDEIARARALRGSAAELVRLRVITLGENHTAAIKAISYHARAHRVFGDESQALSLSESAVTRFGVDHETKRDAVEPAIARVVAGEVLMRRSVAAQRHASTARATKAEHLKNERTDAKVLSGLDQLEYLEMRRSRELRSRATEYLDDALDVLAHQLSAEQWFRRAQLARTALP